MANWTPESRIEEILFDTINGEEYNGLPESRVEELLLELKEVIEEGGGGGGGTSTIAWKPSVALDGTISWTRTASETKPDDQNIKGPKGDDGDPGLGIKQVSINLENHLIITYDDNTTEDAGALPEGGSTTLAGLTDTAITSPTAAQPLTYDATNSKWVNGGNIVSNGFIEDGYGHRLGYSKRSKIDPFPEGASAITFYNANGVTISSSSITDGVGSLTATEAQAGYEGFVIELNVTPGKLHVVSFDYQNIDCEYWTNPTYMLGWTLDNSAKTDYQNIELWSNNIERNATSQHFEATITPSGNKVYLNFNVCGYSDSRSNTFSLSNLTVYELVEDTGEPDALSDLSDTAISSPSDGQILGYNGTSGKWENTTPTIPDISVKQNITLTTPLSIGGVSRTTVESALGALTEQASYLEQTVTLSTSSSTTVTFTDSSITASSFIEYACSQWDLVPESITGAAGSCTIVLPTVESAQSVTVRIYVR